MHSIKQIEIRAKRMEIAEHKGAYATSIAHTQAAESVCRTFLQDLDSERFLVVILDTKHRPMGFAEVARGAAESCPVDMREVFRPAVLLNGSAIIVAHNHPSGDPCPSREDLVLTQRLCEAGVLLGMMVLDHLIIAGPRCVSLATLGVM